VRDLPGPFVYLLRDPRPRSITISRDPRFKQQSLVFSCCRVHPVPETLRDFIFDFGSLEKAQERSYIEAMARNALPNFQKDQVMRMRRTRLRRRRRRRKRRRRRRMRRRWTRRASMTGTACFKVQRTPGKKLNMSLPCQITIASDLLGESQDFIRTVTGDASSSSLRDVQRCLTLIDW
jgi:hypothetical protein